MRACLGLVFLCACLPAPTVLVGLACDPTHDCGPDLFCVNGRCALSPGGGGGAGGGAAGGSSGGAAGGASGGNSDGGTCIVCGDAGCVDISTDAKNCGGCGISCGSGFTCTPAMAGSVRSGKCGCNADPDCPQPGTAGLTQDQNCIAGACICDTVVECGTGQKCTKEQGLSDPGFCFY